MNITKIVVVKFQREIPTVFFITDLPAPPGFEDQTTPFQMKSVLPSTGWKEYLDEHFSNIPVEVIEV